MAVQIDGLLSTPELIQKSGVQNRRRFNYLLFLYGKLLIPACIIGTAKLWKPDTIALLRDIDSDVSKYGVRPRTVKRAK